ncbi:MAG: LCP family protein [Eubacteriales bacterium]|nr:LCP family protein [Eubacteriales bacterium]
MNRRTRWNGKRLAALLTALVLMPVLALAQTDPSDAILAPETLKPWLAVQATATPTAAQTGTIAPTAAPTPAAAQPAEPTTAATGVILAPETLKPWLPVQPTPTPTPPPSSLTLLLTGSITATPPPSSVSLLAEEEPDTLPATLNLESASTIRILLIGSDAYKPNGTGRSDAMVLLQVNVETAEVKMISFLRDLYVAIPGYKKNRLNAAYVFGGASLLEKTLKNNFKVSVDRYLAVNFSLMVKLIDQIGGVTVNVSEKERVQLNSILKFYNTKIGDSKSDQLLKEAGEQCLTGKQALCFSRIRKIDSDFQRVDRQHKVIEAIYRRMLTLSAADLSAVILTAIREVKTDLTLRDALTLAPLAVRLDNVQWDTLTVPVKGGYDSQRVSGMDVLVPYLDKNVRAISNFLQ